MREKNSLSQAVVQYADLADIVKMLDIKGGGSFMDNVNEAQKLVDLADETGQRRKSATRP
jgi:hypothetical protein